MGKYLSEVRELDFLWDQVRIYFEETSGSNNIHSTLNVALEWVAEKQEKFSGIDYFNRIEKNAIYLRECSNIILNIIAKYLFYGEPLIPTQEIETYVFSLRQYAHQRSSDHLSFVRSGCKKCSSHNQHFNYKVLFEKRRKAKPEIYLEEIEYWCIYYQVEFISVQYFLKFFMNDKSYAGIARYLSPNDVFSTLKDRASMTVALWGGLFELVDNNEIQSERLRKPRKPWYEIWADNWENVIDCLI